jgi:SecD/SecF fusion protein
MNGSTLWKLILSALIFGVAVLYLIPYQDTPYKEYILSECNQDEAFIALVDEAEAAYQNEEYYSIYIALRDIALARDIDLSQYFPNLILEASLRNTELRNQVLLDELLMRSKARLQPGLDLKGGVVFVFELSIDEGTSQYDKERDLSKAIDILRDRINALGVTEPVIRTTGENRIEVQLPGVSTKENPEIQKSISKPARLEFRQVHRTQIPSGPGDRNAPVGYEVKALERMDNKGAIQLSYLYIKRIPDVKGDAIDRAYPRIAEFGGYEILMDFTSAGGKQFEQLTREISSGNRPPNDIGRLAITLDGELLTAPNVENPIPGGSARITGSFTQREAEEIANGLNNPLDAELRIAEMYEVGPTMAADAVKSGKQAFMIGAAVVVFFMLLYYMIAGVVAVLAIVFNLIVVLGMLSSMGATVTLPGVAALILTVGMAVDANILIYERIREELRAGKTLKNSLLGGFEKAFSTIVDANVTTLITSFILIYFGTGPVKGFGVTLAVGIGATMFCALIVSRVFLDLLINTEIVKRMLTVSLFKEKTTIDFLNYRKYAFITSWLIVVLGIGMAVKKGQDIYGIDFTGGDEIALHFDQELSVSDVEAIAENIGIGEVSLTLQTPLGANTEPVLKIATPFGEGALLWDGLIKAYPDNGLDLIGTNQIGPTVGKEIQFNAFLSIGIALICILLYVALRFEVGFGVGAVVATVHDLLMTIGIFVLFGNQFSAPMVAALLMIVGYSLNDTIVVFDRIREELELNPGLKLKQVVNLAINRTLSRTILTSVTTLLVTVSLLVFGTGVIRDFAFTFVVGILTGTFSSIFIASPVFFWWHKGDRHHVESHADIMPKYDWKAGSKSKT